MANNWLHMPKTLWAIGSIMYVPTALLKLSGANAATEKHLNSPQTV